MIKYLILLICLTRLVYGTACTSIATGNWNAQTTWGPGGTGCVGPVGGIPGNGDTVTIANTHTITVNVNTTIGSSVAPYWAYLYSVSNATPATGCTATCSAALTGGTAPGEAPILRCNVQPSGAAFVNLVSRGWYPAGATSPTGITITGTGCVAGAGYTLGFQAGNGTPAINTTTGNGKLVIASGVELIVKGSVIYNNAGTYDFITMQPGATLTIDPSSAAANTIYTIGPIGNGSQTNLNASACTLAQPCNVRTLAGNLPGSFARVPGSGFDFGFQAKYTTFTNMGDAQTSGIGYVKVVYDVQNNNFINCGQIGPVTIGQPMIFRHNNNVHIGSRVTSVDPAFRTSVDFEATQVITGGGVREIKGNIFDGKAELNTAAGMGMVQVTIEDNYFGDVFKPSLPYWTSYTRNFNQVLDLNNTFQSANLFVFNGDVSNGYFFINEASANPHSLGPSWGAGGNPTIDTGVLEHYKVTTGDSGEAMVPTSNLAGTVTTKNMIVTQDTAGVASSELSSQSAVTNPTYDFRHNTWFGGYIPPIGFGSIDLDEGGASRAGSYLLLSNIMYAPDSNPYYWKMQTGATGGTGVTDACSPTSNCDYNSGYNYTKTQASCGVNCTNQGNGYAGKWSVTPGVHDIDIVNPDDNLGPGSAGRVNPRFADITRKLALFGTRYLGNSIGASWVVSTSYNIGDVVSVSDAGYFNGFPVNFKCIKAHTSTIQDEPMVGNWSVGGGTLTNLVQSTTKQYALATFPNPHNLSVNNLIEIDHGGLFSGTYRIYDVPSTTTLAIKTNTSGNTTITGTMTISSWRNYWEFDSLVQLRTLLTNKTLITDGAIECANCTAIQALINWVRRGYIPQNQKLWKAGHDGLSTGGKDVSLIAPAIVGAISGVN